MILTEGKVIVGNNEIVFFIRRKLMSDKKVYGHGDVIIVPIAKIPEEANSDGSGKAVLAYGEVTGHSHQISEGIAAMFRYSNKQFLRIQSEMGLLTHEEHKMLRLPRGDFEIKIQREYTPNGWNKVVD